MGKKKPLTLEQARARALAPVTHAISIDAPWAWAIAHADKRAENRSWRLPEAFEGARIAIAATARSVHDDDRAYLLEHCARDYKVPEVDGFVRGAIVATARVIAYGRHTGANVEIVACMPDVDPDHAMDLATSRRQLWIEPDGAFWVLADVDPLAVPLPCKGAQRLWRLPPGLAAKVNAA